MSYKNWETTYNKKYKYCDECGRELVYKGRGQASYGDIYDPETGRLIEYRIWACPKAYGRKFILFGKEIMKGFTNHSVEYKRGRLV